ncbi:MAG: hypothetical protein HYW22_01375 [Candidatus Aenigmarchaeota archaeon]|nr:hypothetical protein [Candidatus Aenigmarchaeota archaeon]
MELDRKRLDAIILVLFFIASTFLIMILRLNHLYSTFLYLVVPSIYLLLKYKNIRKKILIFVLPFGLVGSLLVEYFAEYNKAWVTSSSTLKLLTYVPLESIIWGLGYGAIVLTVYKIFLDFKHHPAANNYNYNWLIILSFCAFLALGIWIFLGPPEIDYAYAKFFGLPTVLILLYVIHKKPNLGPKFLELSIIFLMFSIIYEIIALKLGFWWFPGQYYTLVNIAGVGIPIEEVVLWIALGAPLVAAFFEAFNEV